MANIKGMVLAAGFGTRLKPFTEHLPKPLFPFFGVNLLELGLFRLRDAGVKPVAANAHHHAEKIKAALEGSPLGRDVHLSIELPEILGRGGAFAPLKSWRAGADLLVYNGDIASDVDVLTLLKAHQTQNNVATMMLLPKALTRDSAVYRVGDRVVAISKAPPDIAGATGHGFACLHILTDTFLGLLPQSGNSDVLEGYQRAFTLGLRVGCVIHHGFWHGIETPQNAWDAHMDLLNRGFESEKTGIRQIYQIKNESFAFYEMAKSQVKESRNTQSPGVVGPVFIGSRCILAKDASIGPNVILSGNSSVGAGAQIRNSLLLHGVNIGAGEVVENAVVGFDGRGQRVTVAIKP